MTTVSDDPAQTHQRLEGEVAVAVHEVRHQHVPVARALRSDLVAHLPVTGRSQQKHVAHVRRVIFTHRRPRVSNSLTTLKAVERAGDHHDHLWFRRARRLPAEGGVLDEAGEVREEASLAQHRSVGR